MADPTVLRPRNVLSLFQAYAVATGVTPKGLEQAFAAHAAARRALKTRMKQLAQG